MRFDCTIAGAPIPWKRARLGEKGNRKRFTPKAMKQHKLIVHTAVCAALHELNHNAHPKKWPMNAQYAVALDFYRRRKVDATPDLDNLIKSVLDACNGVLWNDDSQVVRFERIQKHDIRELSDEDDRDERTEITVWVML